MKSFVLCLAIIGILASPAKADFEAGVKAAGRGDFATAYIEWLPLAEKGDAQSQVLIGEILALGLGTKQDDEEAVRWFRRAAEQNYPRGQYSLGSMYYRGQGVPQDFEAAARWYRPAAQKGQQEAMVSLHDLYYRGLADRPDIPQPDIAKHTANPIVADLKDELTGEAKALHDRPFSENAVIVPWLKSHIRQLAPNYLYELSRRVFSYSREEAFAWYWVGHIRARYDAIRCRDRTARQGILALSNIAPDVQEALYEDDAQARSAATMALVMEVEFPTGTLPLWICRLGTQDILAEREGKTLLLFDEVVVPASEWKTLRDRIRAGFSEGIEKQPQDKPQ